MRNLTAIYAFNFKAAEQMLPHGSLLWLHCTYSHESGKFYVPFGRDVMEFTNLSECHRWAVVVHVFLQSDMSSLALCNIKCSIWLRSKGQSAASEA